MDTQAPQRVATGFRFVEGPVWIPAASQLAQMHAKNGALLFNDIPTSRTYCLSDGACTVVRSHNRQANGNFLASDGLLVSCEHEGRRVAKVNLDGSTVSIASHYQGKRLNSPNDLIIGSDGSLWFTDPPYGVRAEERELPFQGVYQVSAEGKLTLVSSEFIKPNGLALSRDETRLFVADTESGRIAVLTLSGRSDHKHAVTFCETARPDGIRLDSKGNLWVAGLNGIEAFSPGGDHLGQIPLPERPANLAFGGEDGLTLFICARTSIYSLRAPWPGATFSRRSTAHG